MNLTKLREILSNATPRPWPCYADENLRTQLYVEDLLRPVIPPSDAIAIHAVMNCADELLECVRLLRNMNNYAHGEDCPHEEGDEVNDYECECGLLEAQEAIAALDAKLEKL